MNLLIRPAMSDIVLSLFFDKDGFGWYANKQRNQTKSILEKSLWPFGVGQWVSINSHSFFCKWMGAFLLMHCVWLNKHTLNIKAGFGQVGRVFAIDPGDLSSISGRVIPKTFTMVLDTSLLNTQQYKVRIEGKVNGGPLKLVDMFTYIESALPYFTYRRKNWNLWLKFKPWTETYAYHFILMTLRKLRIHRNYLVLLISNCLSNVLKAFLRVILCRSKCNLFIYVLI